MPCGQQLRLRLCSSISSGRLTHKRVSRFRGGSALFLSVELREHTVQSNSRTYICGGACEAGMEVHGKVHPGRYMKETV